MKGSLRTIRRPLRAMLMVLANLLALPCALPLLFAAAAALDGEHAVELRCDRAESAVILRHSAATCAAHSRHHHGALAAVITGVSDDPTGSVDHVLHFSGTEAGDQAPPNSDPRTSAGVTFAPVALTSCPVAMPPTPAPVQNGLRIPERSDSSLTRALRSTVLRI